MSTPQRRVARTAAADEDLIAIWLYVGEHNPRAADELLDTLERRIQILAEFPRAGSPRDDIAPGIRQLVEGNYLIFYHIVADGPEVVRVLHARRRITSDEF